MALTAFWNTNQKELEQKHVQQVIGFAGDGKLKDGGPASKEFREYLGLVPPVWLARYADDCLKEKFDNSGFALQDIINQVGTRLGFKVEHGRYRGSPGEIGFDGLWQAPDGNCIVVEVKTTDAYRIDLGTVAAYRRKLMAEGKLDEGKSSILIVVGRSDTGDLEAQVRGSRHAWDIRMISVDFLLRLMRLNEGLGDPKIVNKIRRVLMPQEFTKVDGIVDLVFSAAEEVKKEELSAGATEDDDEGEKKQPKFTPVNFREACAGRVQAKLGVELVKESAAVYSSPDKKTVLVCVNSREYKGPNSSGYWYAFHPYQKELLEGAEKGYVALGCGSEKLILLFPAAEFLAWLPIFHRTEDGDRFYWHVRVKADASGYTLRVKKGNKPIDVTAYLLKV
jgi:hypothetical protein